MPAPEPRTDQEQAVEYFREYFVDPEAGYIVQRPVADIPTEVANFLLFHGYVTQVGDVFVETRAGEDAAYGPPTGST